MSESLSFDENPTGLPGLGGGPPDIRGAAGLYATRLRQLGLLKVEGPQSETFWREVSHHRRAILDRLGRDVGQRVALLDYIVNLQPQLLVPQIIETLEAVVQPSITDPLTGLHSRHFFDLELVREIERARRYGLPLSLVLLDLDGFKAVNARHGRVVADEVLQAVAALMLHQVRAPDVPCRLGEDDFAILLTATPQVEALTVAQRICGDISEWFLRNPVGLQNVRVSASAGVASLVPEGPVAALVEDARSALADAKRLGGHRVVAPISGLRSFESA